MTDGLVSASVASADTSPSTATDLINLGIAIAEGVAQAIPEALAAFGLVQQMVTENRDPTAQEWATLNAAADSLHGSVQEGTPALASAPAAG